MTDQELHYLMSILGHLREFREARTDTVQWTLGDRTLADNIDWLDCFIDREARAAIAREEK